jgi:hypothetical protein
MKSEKIHHDNKREKFTKSASHAKAVYNDGKLSQKVCSCPPF